MNATKLTRYGTQALVLGLCLAMAACSTRVTRMAPEQAIDLSGRWNDVDSRLVADALIRESFEAAHGVNWAMQHARANAGQPPVVIVGTVRNRSMEHIPVGTFVRDLEQAYLRSGQVQVVSSGTERGEIRAEREDQQEHAAGPTRARMAMEQGAHYMLQGEIQSIEDSEGRNRVVYYQVDMTLTDLETNARVWAGQHQLKKYVQRPRFRF
jgi:penicillin-binding protein activator